MKLIVLTKDHSLVVAVRHLGELPAALGCVPWLDLDLARTDQDAYEGYPPPPLGPSDLIDRAHPDLAVVSGVTVVAKIDFYRRATDAEVAAIGTALGAQSPRIQAIFRAAANFRSDAEEWPLLQAAAVGLFGDERAAVLLAPSV